MSMPMPLKLEPTAYWVDSVEAAEILCVTKGALHMIFVRVPNTGIAIRRMTRSVTGRGQSGRGCGHLYLREDLIAVRKLATDAKIGIRDAVKVIAVLRGRGIRV
jgi:hypothetical protein